MNFTVSNTFELHDDKNSYYTKNLPNSLLQSFIIIIIIIYILKLKQEAKAKLLFFTNEINKNHDALIIYSTQRRYCTKHESIDESIFLIVCLYPYL